MKNEPYWPTTLDEAVKAVLASLCGEDIKFIKKMNKEELFQLHHNLGQKIRNEFGLWHGNVDLAKSCGVPVFGNQFIPDLVSEKIIGEVWTVIRYGKDKTS